MSEKPQSMRAWQFSGPGSIAQVLQLSDSVPYPSKTLNKGQVLIRVVAASINPADYKLAELPVLSKLMVKSGKIPGMDCSGVVVQTGADSSLKPGDRVLGRVDPMAGGTGTLAEYTVLDAEGCAKIADNVDFDQAAGATTAALTGLQSIYPYVKEGSGAKVFINGGAGGTGTYAIQCAKQLGCHVTTTCSTAKVDFCKSIGADEVIDYKSADVVAELRTKGQVYDAVVDLVGSDPSTLYQACADFVKPGGHFVLVGASAVGSVAVSLVKGMLLPGFLGGGKRKYHMYSTKNSQADLSRISQWLADGKVKTVVHKTYEFEQVKEAFAELKTGRALGKIIIHVGKQ